MEDAAGIHAVIINYVFLYGPNTAAGQLQQRGTALPRPTPTPGWERPRRGRGPCATPGARPGPLVAAPPSQGPCEAGSGERDRNRSTQPLPSAKGGRVAGEGRVLLPGLSLPSTTPSSPSSGRAAAAPRLLSPSPRWPQGAPGPALNKDGASARQAPLALTKDGSRPLSSFLPSTKMAASPPPADWPSALTLARPRRTRRGPRARPGVPRAPPAGRKRERGGC